MRLRQGLLHAMADLGEQHALIDAMVGVKSVVRAPVTMLQATGAKEVGQRGAFGAEQRGHHVLPQTQGATQRTGGRTRGLKEGVEPLLETQRGVFF
jgi:hypothetical protein